MAKEKLPDFPKSLYAGSLKPPVMDLALNQSCEQTDGLTRPVLWLFSSVNGQLKRASDRCQSEDAR